MIRYALKNKVTLEYVTYYTSSSCFDSDIEIIIGYHDEDIWLCRDKDLMETILRGDKINFYIYDVDAQVYRDRENLEMVEIDFP